MKLKTLLLVALGASLLCTVSCDKDKKGFDGNPVVLEYCGETLFAAYGDDDLVLGIVVQIKASV